MATTSNFNQALKKARSSALVGPDVITNALPYLGGGLVLTAVGTYGGLGFIQSNPTLFMPTFIVAIIAELVLFFVARGIAERANNSTALPLLALYSLLSGCTLTGIVFVAIGTEVHGAACADGRRQVQCVANCSPRIVSTNVPLVCSFLLRRRAAAKSSIGSGSKRRHAGMADRGAHGSKRSWKAP